MVTWRVQHHGGFSVCSLDVSLYGVMMSWGFYEFDELSFDEMTAFKYFSEGLFFVTSSRKGINCNFSFCQWNASYCRTLQVDKSNTLNRYYLTNLSIGDKVRIEKHVQLLFFVMTKLNIRNEY